jgi:hypothetical protein
MFLYFVFAKRTLSAFVVFVSCFFWAKIFAVKNKVIESKIIFFIILICGMKGTKEYVKLEIKLFNRLIIITVLLQSNVLV